MPLQHIIINRGEAEAEELPALLLLDLLGGAEDGAGRDEDAIGLGGQVDPQGLGEPLVVDAAEERVRVKVDVHPQEHAGHGVDKVVHLRLGDELEFVRVGVGGEGAGLGGSPPGGGANDVFAVFEDGRHPLHSSFVVATEALQPSDPSVHVPSGAIFAAASTAVGCALWTHDQLGHHGLHESGGLLGGRFGDLEDLLDEKGLGCDPAKTTARCNGFGKGVKANDASVSVDVKVAWDERVQEGVARGRLWLAGVVIVWLGTGRLIRRDRLPSLLQGQSIRRRILKVPIRIVFNDQDVVDLAKRVYLLSTAQGEES